MAGEKIPRQRAQVTPWGDSSAACLLTTPNDRRRVTPTGEPERRPTTASTASKTEGDEEVAHACSSPEASPLDCASPRIIGTFVPTAVSRLNRAEEE